MRVTEGHCAHPSSPQGQLEPEERRRSQQVGSRGLVGGRCGEAEGLLLREQTSALCDKRLSEEQGARPRPVEFGLQNQGTSPHTRSIILWNLKLSLASFSLMLCVVGARPLRVLCFLRTASRMQSLSPHPHQGFSPAPGDPAHKLLLAADAA